MFTNKNPTYFTYGAMFSVFLQGVLCNSTGCSLVLDRREWQLYRIEILRMRRSLFDSYRPQLNVKRYTLYNEHPTFSQT